MAALQAMSIDLAMAAAREGAELVHSHTWYANLAGHLAKLTYGVPHVATVHSLEPLRPWKAEQLGGGYALSSFCERVGLEGADARDRGVARGCAATSWRATRRSTRDRVRVIYNGIDAEEYHAGPGHRRARAPRRRPGAAVGRVRRPDHAPEGRAVPARGRARVRPGGAARALRGRAGHARDRRRGRAARRAAARGARERRLARPDAAQAGGHPAAQPRDRVRLPVDLRAARDRQPRGDGVRGGGRRDGDRRHRRGRRRRRHGAARPVRAGAGRDRAAPTRRRSRTRSPSGSTSCWPSRSARRRWAAPAASGRSSEFDWSAIAAQTSELYRTLVA